MEARTDIREIGSTSALFDAAFRKVAFRAVERGCRSRVDRNWVSPLYCSRGFSSTASEEATNKVKATKKRMTHDDRQLLFESVFLLKSVCAMKLCGIVGCSKQQGDQTWGPCINKCRRRYDLWRAKWWVILTPKVLVALVQGAQQTYHFTQLYRPTSSRFLHSRNYRV
jgi:hypothetical protein